MESKEHYDFVIIGSGFGGSVSALRLVEKGYKVAIVEQGQRWSANNLPLTNWNFKKWLWIPLLGFKGFFSLRFFKHVVVLHGNAWGGGSITYANTLLEPPMKVWKQGSWAKLEPWEQIMPVFYKRAKKMLGVSENQRVSAADRLLLKMAESTGRSQTFQHTQVGVFFGEGQDKVGRLYDDPYFGGEGPPRNSCVACGGCMVGCRYNAKNTLDLNYLYLAEKKGLRAFTGEKVLDVKPISDQKYEIVTKSSLHLTANHVIFAASSLGTSELLLRLKESGSLPRLSSKLGHGVRTNAESLIGIRFPNHSEDLSQGVAIGSGFYLNDETHIEATRYSKGSSAMSLLTTIMVHGAPGLNRILTLIYQLTLAAIRSPRKLYRLLSPRRWSEQVMILLCMQSVDSTLQFKLSRAWYWPFKKALSTTGNRIPTFIPEANTFAQDMAHQMGGVAATSLPEVLFNVPMTAHCLGGCTMGATAEEGVVDSQLRVHNYENMWIVDGSVVSSNLGVNPSLTITALAEYAMSLVPENTKS